MFSEYDNHGILKYCIEYTIIYNEILVIFKFTGKLWFDIFLDQPFHSSTISQLNHFTAQSSLKYTFG